MNSAPIQTFNMSVLITYKLDISSTWCSKISTSIILHDIFRNSEAAMKYYEVINCQLLQK